MKKQKIIKQVTDKFISQLRITKRKTKRPIVIALIGLIGSGKLIVSGELTKQINATVIVADAIRVALRKQKQGYEQIGSVSEKVALHVLKKEGNVILCSDFVDSQKRKKLEEKAKKFQAKVFYIRTIADRDVMIERLVKTKYNPSRDLFKDNTIAVREMWRRTPHHYRWENKQGGRFILRKLRIPLLAEIDTGNDWKKQVKKVAQKIKKI